MAPVGNAARYGNATIERRVIRKVGRKYIEAWDGQHERSSVLFQIEDLRQKTDYSADYKLYFSEQAIFDDRERDKLLDQMRKLFGSYGRVTLSLDQLRKIINIIQGEGKHA